MWGALVTNQCRQVRMVGTDVLLESCQATHYLSLSYHRVPTYKPGKSKWNLSGSPAAECARFCACEKDPVLDADGNIWDLELNDPPLGTRNERVAMFCKPSPGSSEWHGFPYAGATKRRAGGGVDESDEAARAPRKVPTDVLDSWLRDALIDETLYDKARKGRL